MLLENGNFVANASCTLEWVDYNNSQIHSTANLTKCKVFGGIIDTYEAVINICSNDMRPNGENFILF